MSGKTSTSSDFKKWVFFMLFLAGLVVVIVLVLKPGGESEARNLVQQARVLVQEAQTIAQKTNAPQDLANMDIASEALLRAESHVIESDFSAAIQESEKAILHARKVVDRGATSPQIRNQIRFRHISGEVSIKKKEQPAFEGASDKMPVDSGDTIQTTATGACLLGYSSRMETTIHPASLVTFQDGFDRGNGQVSFLDLYLEDGALTMKTSELQDRGQAHIITDAGKVLVYQNTEATVRYDPARNRTEVKVRLGRVDALSGSQRITLNRNQAALIRQGGAGLRPLELAPPPELGKPEHFAKFEANLNGFASVTLAWAPVNEAASYLLEVSTDKLFTQLIREKTGFVGTTTGFPDLQKGLFYWRISSIDDDGTVGVPSQVRQFQVGEVASERSIPVDSSPPKLKITKVAVQGYIVIIRGNSERDADVTVDGENAILDEYTGNFTYAASLPGKGIYAISVVATDRAGNRAYEEIPVEIKD